MGRSLSRASSTCYWPRPNSIVSKLITDAVFYRNLDTMLVKNIVFKIKLCIDRVGLLNLSQKGTLTHSECMGFKRINSDFSSTFPSRNKHAQKQFLTFQNLYGYLNAKFAVTA